jgi:shikimate dehydrogenase
VVNRTLAKAEAVASRLGPKVRALPWPDAAGAFRDATAVINATSAGLAGEGGLDAPLEATPEACVVMDMVYKPLETPLLRRARALGRPTVDGLEMLIRQAEPSFTAFFGAPPPAEVDVRALALRSLGETP